MQGDTLVSPGRHSRRPTLLEFCKVALDAITVEDLTGGQAQGPVGAFLVSNGTRSQR